MNYYSLCGCSYSSSSSHATLLFSLHLWPNGKYESQNFPCRCNFFIFSCEIFGSPQPNLCLRKRISEKDFGYKHKLCVSYQNPHWCLKHHLWFQKWTLCWKNIQNKYHYMCAFSPDIHQLLTKKGLLIKKNIWFKTISMPQLSKNIDNLDQNISPC